MAVPQALLITADVARRSDFGRALQQVRHRHRTPFYCSEAAAKSSKYATTHDRP